MATITASTASDRDVEPLYMIRIKRYVDLDHEEQICLNEYLSRVEARILPYHSAGFARVIDEVFRYENYSLVAIGADDEVIGYLPQWKKGGMIESTPWRDKGGPACLNNNVLTLFIEETKKIMEGSGAKGFLWKDFETPLLDSYRQFVNVDIDLTKYDAEMYWNRIPFRVRGKIRNGEKNGLVFKVERGNIQNAVHSFYRLFVLNRRRLGVPVYPVSLFESYFRNIPPDQIKMFSVYRDNVLLAALVLLHNRFNAVDAYSASSDLGLKLKANDVMIYSVVRYCLENNIRRLDFGADSPHQKSLIKYKLKWLGEQRMVTTSYFGNVKEVDHNEAKYGPMKKVIRMMPESIYFRFSRRLVR